MQTYGRVVREIPARVVVRDTTSHDNRLVVCAYARVSTDNFEQEESFERQVQHYTAYIQSRHEWKFGGVYADEGLTGTRADRRPEFLRMIQDCRDGKVNKILVKSVSRFARNTLDALGYIRELREIGVGVYFESENIDSLEPGGEVLLTILAAMAEQESRTMSSNIRWAYQKRFKSGKALVNTSQMLGYTKDAEDNYAIVEEEAKIVRRIFREYLGGMTTRQIANGLERDGILSPVGKEKWYHKTIQNMLENEKYTGCALMGKTYKPDVLSKRRLKNEGQRPSYYIENSHPAIISKEMFDLVQAETEKRMSLRSTSETGDGKYSSMYVLSGLLVCGNCGGKYRRHKREYKGEEQITWICINHQRNGNAVCDAKSLKEEEIIKAYNKVMGQLAEYKEEIATILKENINQELLGSGAEELEAKQDEILSYQEKIMQLHKDRHSHQISEREYSERLEEYSGILTQLEAELHEMGIANHKANLASRRIDEILDAIDRNTNIDDPTNGMIRQLIKKIVVCSRNELEFEFECGLRIKQTI